MRIDSTEIKEAITLLTYLDTLGHARIQALCRWNPNDFMAGMVSSDPQSTMPYEYSFSGVAAQKFVMSHIDEEIKDTIRRLSGYGITINDEPLQ
jgi:hypothetical protein